MKIPSALVLTLAVALALPCHAQRLTSSNSKALKLFEKGQTALYQSRTTEALRLVEQALQADPAFAEASLLLAEWHLDAGNDGLATRYYRQTVEHHPDFFPLAWFQLGELELKAGHNEAAIDHYKQFLQRDRRYPDRHVAAEHGMACARFRLQALANPVDFQPENLGANVNGPYDEYLPALTADGATLVFTRRGPRRASTTASTAEEEDFYISQLHDGQWSAAQRMAEPVNSNDNEGAQCISRDGRIMIFTACGRPDGAGRCDLYLCTRHGDHWSAPRNMGAPINSAAWESQPSLSYDGNTLYFVSNRQGGQGGMDIWMSQRVEGQWSEPVNLGPTVNTPGDESSPFIHPDNQTLYFASTGHVGMGGSDLFVSRRTHDGTWGTPTNLGYPINTEADESNLIVSADGRTAYFSSDHLGGYGRQDLYRFALPTEVRPQEVVYREALDTIVPSLRVGESITLQNIFFETGRYALLETSKVELDRVAELLLRHPTLKVELGGHTDNVGRPESNATLSEQRARAVYDYLVQQGVPAARLSYRGYGQTQPVAPNDTPEGRAANRRTTFTLIEK